MVSTLCSEAFEVVGLGVVVEFLAQAVAELADPVGEAHPVTDARQAVGRPCGAFEQIQVLHHLGLDARTLHFHRDRPAVVQPRAINLRQRGAPDRLGIEPGEQRGDRRAQRRFDHWRHLRPGLLLDAVLHAFERCGEFRRHHVAAGGQRLADLDEGRSERLEIGGEGARELRIHAPARGVVDVEHPGAPITRQEPQDARAAREMRGGRIFRSRNRSDAGIHTADRCERFFSGALYCRPR
jgi:hypothetical protein